MHNCGTKLSQARNPFITTLMILLSANHDILNLINHDLFSFIVAVLKLIRTKKYVILLFNQKQNGKRTFG